ncbi:MAG: hypothetical protein IJC87_02775 [Clostridia bacterium]|nr:hypothetical protein [Clostridia bacterium]
MNVSFFNGKIVIDGYLYEEVPYDVSANNLSVCFDGKGGLTKYLSVCNGKNHLIRSFLSLYKDGERIGAYTLKHVEVCGRIQEIRLTGDGYRVDITQFISKNDDAVFIKFDFYSKKQSEFTLEYSVFSEKPPTFSSEKPYEEIPENSSVEYKVKVLGKESFPFVISFEQSQNYCDGLVLAFEEKLGISKKEISDVKIPVSAKTEQEKAQYLSSLFCCIENYKECQNIKGFVAGCNYLNPVRTYYRDSYWTALSVYEYDASLVKRQIITLAKGIASDGTCPSAVKKDLSGFWSGHYDSPSFFVMMVYDYVNHTGDKGVLSVQINGKTLIDLCEAVVLKQIEKTDETGLLKKQGPYNKLDWADEVNRNGYVTYDEALFYRALYCLERLCKTCRRDVSAYGVMAGRVKDKINEILWDEEKGYYVNYKDGDFTEDNLSVDTVLVYLFGISDEIRSKRMLDAMEKHLETKNNKRQLAGDYGIMCVYPFYKKPTATSYKSSQDYEYHNGANWPYLSALYAYAKYLAGRDYKYALESWFSYNLNDGIFTPIEYFSPCRKSGSTLQAWSGLSAFVYDNIGKKSFFDSKFIK